MNVISLFFKKKTLLHFFSQKFLYMPEELLQMKTFLIFARKKKFLWRVYTLRIYPSEPSWDSMPITESKRHHSFKQMLLFWCQLSITFPSLWCVEHRTAVTTWKWCSEIYWRLMLWNLLKIEASISTQTFFRLNVERYIIAVPGTV